MNVWEDLYFMVIWQSNTRSVLVVVVCHRLTSCELAGAGLWSRKLSSQSTIRRLETTSSNVKSIKTQIHLTETSRINSQLGGGPQQNSEFNSNNGSRAWNRFHTSATSQSALQPWLWNRRWRRRLFSSGLPSFWRYAIEVGMSLTETTWLNPTFQVHSLSIIHIFIYL